MVGRLLVVRMFGYDAFVFYVLPSFINNIARAVIFRKRIEANSELPGGEFDWQ